MDEQRFRFDVLERLRADPQTPAELVEEIAATLQPVVGLAYHDGDGDDGDGEPVPLGASKTGGLPHVPAGFVWPTEEGTDEPLALVCQINLAEAAAAAPGRLPSTGMLYLFSIADGDRAYGYEIDDETTALVYEPAPGPLAVAEAPAELAALDAVLPEWALRVGPSFGCQEPQPADGRPQSQRFDYDVEQAIERAIEAAGGVADGVGRMLGDAHLFREEMAEFYDPARQVLLLSLDGYSLAREAFGEGQFHVLVDRDALAAGDLAKAEILFEPGT